MTARPPVTVVDPRADGLTAPAAARERGWSRPQRALALAAATVLVVALVAARHLQSGAAARWTAAATGTGVVLDGPALLRLDLVVAGRGHELPEVDGLRADGGWQLLGPPPSRLGSGTVLSLVHPTGCGRPLAAPRHLTLRTTGGGSLLVPVRVRRPLDGCDPLRGADAVRAVTSSLVSGSPASRQLTVRLGLVDLSTRAVTLSAVRYDGFSFTARRPLPMTLPGRDPDRPLELARLPVSDLVVTAVVRDCPTARRALDEVARHGDPDALEVVLDGRPARLRARGIAAYLDLQWRATCVP